MWGVKASVIPVVIRAFRAVTPKLGEWLQQISGITCEISIMKSTILGTAKILYRIFMPTLEGDTRPPTGQEWGTFFYIYIN